MKNFREIEQLSAYLDGELNSSESARLETRLRSDPELDAILSDLRSARSLLKKLPARKAPRNFTLTRKMVGLKPPLPRTYPLFRLATTFATILFILSFSVNALSPYITFGASATPFFGMGGGGGGDEFSMQEAPAATEEAPAAEAPMMEVAPAATDGETANDAGSAAATEDATRIMEPTPAAEIAPKDVQPESSEPAQTLEAQPQPEVQNEAPKAPIPVIWVIAFLVIGILSTAVTWFMRQSAASKWR